jgi:hypothetical protein
VRGDKFIQKNKGVNFETRAFKSCCGYKLAAF